MVRRPAGHRGRHPPHGEPPQEVRFARTQFRVVALVEDPRVEATPFEVSITLKNGCLHPLSFMDFKVVPRQIRKTLAPRRSCGVRPRTPWGSGPYQFQGPATADQVQYVIFDQPLLSAGEPIGPATNSRHSPLSYPRRAGQGNAREDRLHLWIDVPTQKIKELAKEGIEPGANPHAGQSPPFISWPSITTTNPCKTRNSVRPWPTVAVAGPLRPPPSGISQHRRRKPAPHHRRHGPREIAPRPDRALPRRLVGLLPR